MHVTVETVMSTLKRMKQVGHSKFHSGKLISLFPDHFQNNNENDQYHNVSVGANSSLQSLY